ncbi:neuraminidase (sialidase) [Algoriphagus lacus]|uniref:Neuraminidase (Sialidase) n=1 Tax=Algoriphagus lacus TaxID=2056311 RepID=A0A418PN56_9BACT|nr:sialidase family protein [Algoriphagus lacus]RIW13171.1 neuraminidase (sialidase) [Algoriphagus lacus]
MKQFLIQILRISSFSIFSVFLFECNNSKTSEYAHAEISDSLRLIPVSSGKIFESHPEFAQGHASTIVAVNPGEYLIAWFGGTHEKHDDVSIWMSRGDGKTWETPQKVAKIRNDPHWNPVLFNAPDGKLHLYFKVGKEIDDWETWVQTSEDKGKTWSEPKELVPGDRGGRGPVRNHILILSDGTWLAPASNEKNKVWNAFLDRSMDGGKTWEATPFLELDRTLIPEEGVIQPTAWESSPGNVHLLMRSSGGKIARSDSKDYGKTWSPIYLTDLPNNNSAIEVAHLGREKIALIYNPVSGNWGDRNPINLAISLDNGKSWKIDQIIEKGDDPETEFSYPSIILDGEHLVLTYTWNRQKVAFWKFKIEGLDSAK